MIIRSLILPILYICIITNMQSRILEVHLDELFCDAFTDKDLLLNSLSSNSLFTSEGKSRVKHNMIVTIH